MSALIQDFYFTKINNRAYDVIIENVKAANTRADKLAALPRWRWRNHLDYRFTVSHNAKRHLRFADFLQQSQTLRLELRYSNLAHSHLPLELYLLD